MDYLKECLIYVGTIFPMVNPFSTLPLFLSLTARMSTEGRQKIGNAACRNAAIIMIVSLFLGTLFLHFFSISISSVRVAGGLVVCFLGFSMIFPRSNPDGAVDYNSASQSTVNYSFIPLAFPSMAGAGTIATILSISAINATGNWGERFYNYSACTIAIIVVGLLSLLVLKTANRIKKFLGTEGIDAMTRMMGLVMVCIGVQFIATGVSEFQSNHEEKVREKSVEKTTQQSVPIEGREKKDESIPL